MIRNDVSSGNWHVMYEKSFMDLKTPPGTLKLIYELLPSESEFDMLVFLPTATACPTRRKRRLHYYFFIKAFINPTYVVFAVKAALSHCLPCYCRLSGRP